MATRKDWLRKKKLRKCSWMTDTLKKKFYGGKSQEYNGLKKEKKTLLSFTELWSNEEIIT